MEYGIERIRGGPWFSNRVREVKRVLGYYQRGRAREDELREVFIQNVKMMVVRLESGRCRSIIFKSELDLILSILGDEPESEKISRVEKNMVKREIERIIINTASMRIEEGENDRELKVIVDSSEVGDDWGKYWNKSEVKLMKGDWGKDWTDEWLGCSYRWGVILEKCCVLAGDDAGFVREMLVRLAKGVRWESCMVKRLKKVTEDIKAGIPDSLTGLGRWFVDLHRNLGYSKIGEDPLEEWHQSSVETEPKDYSEFGEVIQKIISEWGVKESSLSFMEYIKDRGNFVVSGASTTPPLEVLITDSDNNVRREKLRSKEGSLLGYSNEEIYSNCMAKGCDIKIFEKTDEPGPKRRIVVNVDVWSFIRSSYICSWMGKSPDWTSLGNGNRDNIRMYEEMQSLGDMTKVSVDFEKFDKSTAVELIILVFDAISEVARSTIVSDDLLEVIAVEREAILNMMYVYGNKAYKAKFLCSGHFLTAIFGTVVNRALFLLCNPCVEKSVAWHQGDDIAVFVDGDGHEWLEDFALRCRKYGYSVNPLKVSVSNSGIEFLRYWITERSVRGYPGRGLLSSLWYKPVSSLEVTSWFDKAREQAEAMIRIERRGGFVSDKMFIESVCRVIPRRFAGQKNNVLKRLCYPVIDGGLGYRPELKLRGDKACEVNLRAEAKEEDRVRAKVDGEVFRLRLRMLVRNLPDGRKRKVELRKAVVRTIADCSDRGFRIPGSVDWSPSDGRGWWSNQVILDGIYTGLVRGTRVISDHLPGRVRESLVTLEKLTKYSGWSCERLARYIKKWGNSAGGVFIGRDKKEELVLREEWNQVYHNLFRNSIFNGKARDMLFELNGRGDISMLLRVV